MNNPYSDANKWNTEAFRNLQPKMKLVWCYLWDNCDHAGFWSIDIGLLCFQLNIQTTVEEIISAFPENLQKITNDLWLTGFIKYQQKREIHELNEKNNCHRSIITILKLKGFDALLSPSLGAGEGLGKVMYGNSNVLGIAQSVNVDNYEAVSQDAVCEQKISHDPELMALQIWNAIKRFGNSNTVSARDALGSDTWAMVKALGGWYSLCQLPSNDYSIRNLIGRIKGLQRVPPLTQVAN